MISKAELSLVVHRIGKTLLLDELDLPAILNYVSQVCLFILHQTNCYALCQGVGLGKKGKP